MMDELEATESRLDAASCFLSAVAALSVCGKILVIVLALTSAYLLRGVVPSVTVSPSPPPLIDLLRTRFVSFGARTRVLSSAGLDVYASPSYFSLSFARR